MQTRSLLITAIAVAFMVLATSAQAQNRFKWRDASGQVHYSDTLTRDAMQGGYELVNKDGVTIRKVNRPLTAQERSAAEKTAAQARSDQDAIEAQKRNDQQLLAAFPTEAELLTTQRLALGQIGQSVQAAKDGLQTQESSLAELLGRADDAQHRDNKVPARLAKQIKDLRAQLETQREFLERKELDRSTMAAAQAAQITHYRELKAAQAAATANTERP